MFLKLRKTMGGFLPDDEESAKVFNRLKDDTAIFAEYKPRRNMQFHKKYFALLNKVIQNQEHYKNVENLHEVIKFKSGYYETIFTQEGQSFVKTKSISFDKMDALEFSDFFNTAIDECISLVGDKAVEDILKFI